MAPLADRLDECKARTAALLALAPEVRAVPVAVPTLPDPPAGWSVRIARDPVRLDGRWRLVATFTPAGARRATHVIRLENLCAEQVESFNPSTQWRNP